MEVNEPVLDSATVARLRQLADSVARPGEDLIARLVDIFVTDSRTRFNECAACWRTGDHVVAGRAAHTIKGSASNLGANRVVVGARTIEDACRNGAPVDEAALTALDAALVEAHAALRELSASSAMPA